MNKIKPMLARDGGCATNSPDMLWEEKYDGARIIALVSGKSVQLQARSGTDKTATFPELRLETKLPAIIDGEVISANGKSFQEGIQPRVNVSDSRKISERVKTLPAKMMVFDVLEIDGKSVENLPLLTRKELLAQTLVVTENVHLAPWTDDGEALFARAKAQQQEGIVGKAKLGRYLRDKREWVKVKCWQEDTFLAVGYTAGTGWRVPTFGALVLSDIRGRYVGEVGTGFNDGDLVDLMRMFSPATCPFPREPEPATWIKPFAIRVRFLEVTNEGMLRFPSFKGVV